MLIHIPYVDHQSDGCLIDVVCAVVEHRLARHDALSTLDTVIIYHVVRLRDVSRVVLYCWYVVDDVCKYRLVSIGFEMCPSVARYSSIYLSSCRAIYL